MKLPRPTNRQVSKKRLQDWDGVKDVDVGPASVEAREKGNLHVTGQGVDRDDSGLDDVEERRKRFGFLY